MFSNPKNEEKKENFFHITNNELRVYSDRLFENIEQKPDYLSTTDVVRKVKSGLWIAEESPFSFNLYKPFSSLHIYQPLILHHIDAAVANTIDIHPSTKHSLFEMNIILCSANKPLLALNYKDVIAESAYGNEEVIVLLLELYNRGKGISERYEWWIIIVKTYFYERLRNYKIDHIEISSSDLIIKGSFANEDRIIRIHPHGSTSLEDKIPIIQQIQDEYKKICKVLGNTIMYYPGYLDDLLLETIGKSRMLNKLSIERKALTPPLVNWSYNNIITYEYSNLSFKDYTNFILRTRGNLQYNDLVSFLNRYSRKVQEVWDRGSKKVKELQSFLPTYFTSLLDIGCNDGVITTALQREYKLDKEQTYCIDVKEVKNSALTVLRYAESNSKTSRVKNIIPLPDSSVDVVLLLEVLHHSLSPIEVLSEARRVLKAHGRLIIAEHDSDGTTAFTEGLDLIHWIYDIVNKENNPGAYSHYMTLKELNFLTAPFFIFDKMKARSHDPLRRYYIAYNNRDK